jgi:AhpD family alkylhydroperoxidase
MSPGAPAPRDGWAGVAAPRIAPGSGRELGWFARAFVRIAALRTGGRAVNIFATLGRHPRLFNGWLFFASRLMPGGRLPRVDQELVILRVGWNTRCRYEWAQHVPIARSVGVTDAQIADVQVGPEAPGWSARQRAILRAVDELHDRRMISDRTWADLCAHLDERERIELCMLVGHYEMVAMTLLSTGVQVDAAAEDA